MKILYWSGLFWPHMGGVEVLALDFIPALQKKGYEFIVLTSQSSSVLPLKEIYNGIFIYRVPFHQGLENHNIEEIKRVKDLVSEIKQNYKPDLIHVNSVDASLYYHLITSHSENSAPVLLTVHSLPPHITNKDSLAMKLLNTAEWITTASAAMYTAVNNIIDNADKQNHSLIYYGIKMPDMKPAPLPFSPPRLLCAGRLSAEKGFDLAIASLAEVLDKYPEVRLTIAGDGPERNRLEMKAEQLGISSSVDFIGWVQPEKVPELINDSTIVIIPSRWEEPFGLIALQAAQLGRPAVASLSGGLPEIIENGRTGMLFPKENQKALTDQIIYLLQNPGTAVAMGQNAFTEAYRKFSFDKYINDYDQLYKNIITQSIKVSQSFYN